MHSAIKTFLFFISAVLFAFLSCAFSLSLAYSDEISIQYLVYRPSFTAANLTSLRAFGLKNQGQPAMNTRFELAGNATAYAIISLSTASLVEDSAIKNFVGEGRMQMIGAIVIKRRYDSRTAGMITEVESYDCWNSRRFVCPPYDFDRDW